jgi:predicted enzyme related to lactoylglutathione lyase
MTILTYIETVAFCLCHVSSIYVTSMPGGFLVCRVQLALNVDDLDEAITFYTKLFGVSPAEAKPGYANFAVTEPPLKLVLLEHPGTGGTMRQRGASRRS